MLSNVSPLVLDLNEENWGALLHIENYLCVNGRPHTVSQIDSCHPVGGGHVCASQFLSTIGFNTFLVLFRITLAILRNMKKTLILTKRLDLIEDKDKDGEGREDLALCDNPMAGMEL